MGKRTYESPQVFDTSSTEWPAWGWKLYEACDAETSSWLLSQIPGRPTFALQGWTDMPPGRLDRETGELVADRLQSTASALQRWVESQRPELAARKEAQGRPRRRYKTRPKKKAPVPKGRDRGQGGLF